VADPPLHLYHSACQFYNARAVGATRLLNSGFPVAFNIFLKPAGATIDVDVHELPIENGVERTLKAIDIAEASGMTLDHINFSGRGFQSFFNVNDDEILREPNPLKRMEMYREKRTSFVQELVTKGLVSKHDKEITCDPKRIVRALGSVNGRSGYIVTQIAPNDLPSFRLDSIQKIQDVALLAQESRKAMKTAHSTKSVKGVGVSCSMPTSLKSHLSGICLFSRIMGVKNRHAFMAQFQESERGNITDKLHGIIERHDFPDFYIFDFHIWTFALSLIAIETAQFFKTLKQEKLMVSAQFLAKYRQLYMVFGNVRRIFAPIKNCRTALVSRGHMNFLKSVGVDVFNHPRLCGFDDVALKEGTVTPPDV
jgi:hypothetical protein